VAERLALKRYVGGDEIKEVMRGVRKAAPDKIAESDQHELSRQKAEC
jgi:hypothetical protein